MRRKIRELAVPALEAHSSADCSLTTSFGTTRILEAARALELDITSIEGAKVANASLVAIAHQSVREVSARLLSNGGEFFR